MEEESLKEEVKKTFNRLENFFKSNEREIASFENRASIIYDHKKYLRELKKALINITKGKILDDSISNKKEVLKNANEVKKLLEKFSDYMDLKKDLEDFEEKEKKVLQEGMEDLRDRWKNLLKKKQLISEEIKKENMTDEEKKAMEKHFYSIKTFDDIIKHIAGVFYLEKEDYELILRSYSKMTRDFNDIIDKYDEELKHEISVLDEIIKEFSQKKFLEKEKIESWIKNCDTFIKELNYLIKKEKEEVHEQLNTLIDRIGYSRKKAEELIKFKDITEEDISRDMQIFTRPSEYARYKDIIDETIGLESLNPKIKRKLIWGAKFGRVIEKRHVFGQITFLSRISEKDSLTGLDSKRTFHHKHKDEFANLFTRDKFFENTISFVFFDLDDFKIINDTYGHTIGDLLLKEVGKIVRENLRKNEVGIRYGGEEFLLILPKTTKNEAKTKIERISGGIKSSSFNLDIGHGEKLRKNITISAGISEFKEDIDEKEIKELNELLIPELNKSNKDIKKIQKIAHSIWGELTKIADERLYYVKDKGKDNTELKKRKERKR